MWSRLIKLPPLHDRSCRDWIQRTVIVEYALPLLSVQFDRGSVSGN
jgi:hypothetical protein